MHEKRIEIRWRDVDAYGHVNNAVYLTYLEEVRDEWLRGRPGEPRELGGSVPPPGAHGFPPAAPAIRGAMSPPGSRSTSGASSRRTTTPSWRASGSPGSGRRA